MKEVRVIRGDAALRGPLNAGDWWILWKFSGKPTVGAGLAYWRDGVAVLVETC